MLRGARTARERRRPEINGWRGEGPPRLSGLPRDVREEAERHRPGGDAPECLQALRHGGRGRDLAGGAQGNADRQRQAS